MTYNNISEQFNLGLFQEDLDFVDINLNNDNLLFIDPRLIEFNQDKICKDMQVNIEKFWGELIKFVKSKKYKEIKNLLSGMKEPNETKLGYSSRKVKGNSISKILKSKLVKAISENKAVQSGILSHFADVELFIEDISSDRISDITTKLIKENLISYTQEQCIKLGIPMEDLGQDDIFNSTSLSWDKRIVKLPSYLGKPILFVPKNIVRLEFSSTSNLSCFYRFAIRNFIVNDKDLIVDITPTGKDGELQLKDIKAVYPCSKESMSNWILKYGKLLVDYKSKSLNDKIKPLTDVDIMNIVYDDINQNVG